MFYDISHVHGVRVAVLDYEDDQHATMRIKNAIQLINFADPQRMRRIALDLKGGIVVEPRFRHHAQLETSTLTCELTTSYVRSNAAIEELAMIIVHEATHARLWRAGISYDEPIRTRVEATCIRREMAFADKLVGGEHWCEIAQDDIDELPELDLSDEAFYNQQKFYKWRNLRELRRNGAPCWFIRLLGGIGKVIRVLRQAYQDVASRFTASTC